MEVYIEYVIFNNLIIDYFIILFTGLICSCKIRKTNFIFSLAVGVVFTIIMPIIKVGFALQILYKILVVFLMTILLKKYRNIQEFFKFCIVLISITFLFGGMAISLNSINGIKVGGGNILINGYDFPIGLMMIFMGGYIYLLLKLIKYFKHRNKLSHCYYDVTIKQNNKIYLLRGFVDTGNKLLDENVPVIIVSLNKFVKIFKDYPLDRLAIGRSPNNAHYIKVSSVSRSTNMLVLDIEELHMKNDISSKVITNVKMGISTSDFSSDFDVLLHSTF